MLVVAGEFEQAEQVKAPAVQQVGVLAELAYFPVSAVQVDGASRDNLKEFDVEDVA